MPRLVVLTLQRIVDDMQMAKQSQKDRKTITNILASRQKLKGYEVDHSTTVETKKKPGIARALHDLFVQKGELCSAEAHRLLEQAGRKTSYVTVQRLSEEGNVAFVIPPGGRPI